MSLLFNPSQAEWVALNYVPFAERSLEVVVDLYHKTACHKAVINEKVLQNIIKVFTVSQTPKVKFEKSQNSNKKIGLMKLIKHV